MLLDTLREAEQAEPGSGQSTSPHPDCVPCALPPARGAAGGAAAPSIRLAPPCPARGRPGALGGAGLSAEPAAPRAAPVVYHPLSCITPCRVSPPAECHRRRGRCLRAVPALRLTPSGAHSGHRGADLARGAPPAPGPAPPGRPLPHPRLRGRRGRSGPGSAALTMATPRRGSGDGPCGPSAPQPSRDTPGVPPDLPPQPPAPQAPPGDPCAAPAPAPPPGASPGPARPPGRGDSAEQGRGQRPAPAPARRHG